MTSRDSFLARLRVRCEPGPPPELPPLHADRGRDLADEFAAAAEVVGFHVHHDVDVETIVRGRRETEVGVSQALFGLARTGSVVLASSPGEPRRRSLLPPVHVSVVSRDDLLPGLPELFAELGPNLPSWVAVVTGPSRSADIEQILTIGVQGPGEVHVVLV